MKSKEFWEFREEFIKLKWFIIHGKFREDCTLSWQECRNEEEWYCIVHTNNKRIPVSSHDGKRYLSEEQSQLIESLRIEFAYFWWEKILGKDFLGWLLLVNCEVSQKRIKSKDGITLFQWESHPLIEDRLILNIRGNAPLSFEEVKEALNNGTIDLRVTMMGVRA